MEKRGFLNFTFHHRWTTSELFRFEIERIHITCFGWRQSGEKIIIIERLDRHRIGRQGEGCNTLHDFLFLSLSNLLKFFVLISVLEVLRERQIVFILDVHLFACGEIHWISLEQHFLEFLVFALEMHELHIGSLVLVTEKPEFLHVVFLEHEFFRHEERLRFEVVSRRFSFFFWHFRTFLMEILRHHGPSAAIGLLVTVNLDDLSVMRWLHPESARFRSRSVF